MLKSVAVKATTVCIQYACIAPMASKLQCDIFQCIVNATSIDSKLVVKAKGLVTIGSRLMLSFTCYHCYRCGTELVYQYITK